MSALSRIMEMQNLFHVITRCLPGPRMGHVWRVCRRR